MLRADQAQRPKDAGLDYYNHNLDTSPEFYGSIITTRTYQDRLDTLGTCARPASKVCSGGILGMGESLRDRAGMLVQLANLPEHPESVPINLLVRSRARRCNGRDRLDGIDFVARSRSARP